MEIRRFGVVGAGTMGHGIAQVAAQAGSRGVAGRRRAGGARARAWRRSARASRSWWRRASSPPRSATRPSAGSAAARRPRRARRRPTWWSRRWSSSFEVKREVFRAPRPRSAAPDAILATNTSSISITKLAAATAAAGPGDRHALHEPGAADAAGRGDPRPGHRAGDLRRGRGGDAARMGKTPVEVHDSPGFVSNRVLMPMINEAIFCLHEGVGKPRGDRRGDEARHEPPDGAARPGRPHRPRRLPRHPARPPRGLRRPQVPPLPAAGQDGRRRPSRPQERARLLRVRRGERPSAGAVCQVCGAANRDDQRVLRRAATRSCWCCRVAAAEDEELRGRAAKRASRSTSTCSSASRSSRRRSSAPPRPCASCSAPCTSRRRTCSSARPASSTLRELLEQRARHRRARSGATSGSRRWTTSCWRSRSASASWRSRTASPALYHGDKRKVFLAAPRRRRVRALRLRRRARAWRRSSGLQARPRQLRAAPSSSARPHFNEGDADAGAGLLHARARGQARPLRGAGLQRRHPARARRPRRAPRTLLEARRRRSTRTPSCRTSAWARSTPAQGKLARRCVFLERAVDDRPGAAGALPARQLLLRDGQASAGDPVPPGGGAARPGASRRPTTCSASPTSTGTGTRRRSRPSARRSG